ncbi:MAG: VirK/YbjX family protein [Clostridium sp.]|uniref:VirK/YbjX family protein n=1 Tax=Clostridium sp. TaxID=1506 RepID=UPI003EE54EDA
MLQSLTLFKNVIKKGEKKGELNTTKKKIKFIFRTLLTLKSSLKLSEFILKHNYLKEKIYSYPILISKIHRPYLKKNMRTSDKLNTIINKYKTVDEIFNEHLLSELYLTGKINLAKIIGKEGNNFFISLEMYPFFDKEGEINLKLLDSDSIPLSTLTFSFLKNSQLKPIIFIGGIQGAPKEIDKECIKEATKELYGIFPKKLLIEALYIIEKALNVNIEKFSVSNKTHIYKAQRYIRKRVIHSDYDSFLESLESTYLENGIWKLPTNLNKKNLEEIPSKKRGQYLKKIALIENIENQIITKLQRY